MIRVYFEHKGFAHLVAVFDDEETLAYCYPALEKLREKHGYDQMTESVNGECCLQDIQIVRIEKDTI